MDSPPLKKAFPAGRRNQKQAPPREEEATALIGLSKARHEPRCGKFASKSRKSNRLLRVNRLGGDMLGCLREFLASRNVINQTERYEKMAGARLGPEPVRETDLRQQSAGRFDCPQLRAKWLSGGRSAGRLQQAERVKKFEQCGGRAGCEAKRQIGPLFADLLSGRHGNRLTPLLKLLRAPVVLAALFSLALAVSLIILYTLSFHHCQLRGGELELARSRRVKAGELRQARGERNKSETGAGLVTVRTECGPYQGQPEGGALKFRGVAYASPPVGPRRWQKPRPIWLDAELCPRGSSWPEQVAREHCVQLSPFNHRVSGSEDCLYLDVYTPARLNRSARPGSAEGLPVMVYIHGGFLVFGSNGAEPQSRQGQVNWLRARPSGQLASELNAVLVAPNYRLQALGFMALKQLALDNGPDGSEGNYGLWDQLIALQWIRRNIDSFGGNPNNVLLFGPDAASALPLALVSRKRAGPNRDQDVDCAPEACRAGGHSDDDYEQLFHSVWLMNPTIYYELPYELANQHYARLVRSQSVCSGELGAARPAAPSPPPPPVSARNRTDRHAAKLADWQEARRSNRTGRQLLDCLLGLPGEQVVREYLGRDDAAFRLDDENSLPIRNIFPDQFVTIDGGLVRDSFPFQKAAGGPRAPPQTRFLIGSTAQAVEFWPCPRNLAGWSWADFRHYVATSLNSFTQAEDTFARACELYQVPAECAATNRSGCPGAAASPTETYLTMVSDIRQVCPAQELARSLRAAGSVGSLERYVVEWRPSGRLASGLAAGRDDRNASHLQHAFHFWDLLALFGFEFEPRLEPQEEDLEFQRHIRALAKRTAWTGQRALGGEPERGLVSDGPHDKRADRQPKTPDRQEAAPGERFSLFTSDNQVRSGAGGAHKRRECKMWQQSLKQSYAWIS